MSRFGTLQLSIALVASLAANLGLGVLLHIRGAEAELSEEMARDRADERNLLMGLMPMLDPAITSNELALRLRAAHPGEPVNVVDGNECSGCVQVQWRLFHFWFDSSGRMTEVQWSS